MKYRRSLNRRTFLRGAGGVVIGLPFLDEMRTRSVWAAPGDPPVRAFNVFFGGGAPAIHQRKGLIDALAPLAPLASKMTFVRGIQGPDGHGTAAGAAFVGKGLVSNGQAGGPSIDNEIMRHAYPTGVPTPIKTLGMGAYYKFLDNPSRWTKSWDERGLPSTELIDSPAGMFARLFGATPGGAAPMAPVGMGTPAPTGPTRAQKLSKSVLDTVLDQYKTLTGPASSLSVASRATVKNHLDSLRELEMRASGAAPIGMGMTGVSCVYPSAPAAELYVSKHHNGQASGGAVPVDGFLTSWKVMSELFVTAVRCDLVRFGFTVACCAGDGMAPQGPYSVAGQMINMGSSGETHNVNHAMGDNPGTFSQAVTYNMWHTHFLLECCADVLTRLDDPNFRDANGKTILENSFVLLGTDLGTNHSGASVFHGVSSAGGKFKPGMVDAQGSLADFLQTCKAGMGLGGATPVAGLLA